MSRFFMVLFFFPSVFLAQYSPKEIDSLMTTEVYRLRDENNIQEIANLSKKIIQNSKKINYPKGEIYGYARLGNALCNLRDYKEALEALNKASHLVEKSGIKDNVIRASIYLGIGRCYLESKTSYQNALVQFEKALFFAKKIENPSEKETYLTIIYGNFYSVHSNLGDEKKSTLYLWKILGIKEEPYALYSLARHHNIYTHNSDSAKYYLEKAEKIALNDLEKTELYIQWGRYYEEKGDYDKAVVYYKKAEVLARKRNGIILLDHSLSGLYNTYKKMGNLQEAILYSHKRVLIKDSIINIQSKNTDSTIKDIVQKNEKNISQKFSRSQKIYIAFAILTSIFLLIFLIKTKKNQKEKDKAIKIIEEKSEENQELKQKLNEAFEEVVQLAKTNSPEFWGRFQEVYPKFRTQLLQINSDLKSTELILAAYTFLGFNTKGIAKYTFKAEKTIRNNKYNLRKKLDVPAKSDFTIWIRNQIEE